MQTSGNGKLKDVIYQHLRARHYGNSVLTVEQQTMNCLGDERLYRKTDDVQRKPEL